MADVKNVAREAESDFLCGESANAIKLLKDMMALQECNNETDIRIVNNIIAVGARQHGDSITTASSKLLEAMGHASIKDLLKSGDMPVSHTCAILNMAVMLFHQSRFDECVQLLWTIFRQVHALSTGFGIKLGFSLLDAMLRSWEAQCGVVDLSDVRKARFSAATSHVIAFLSQHIFPSGISARVDREEQVTDSTVDVLSNCVRDLLFLRMKVYQCQISLFLGQAVDKIFPDNVRQILRDIERSTDLERVWAARRPLSSCCLSSWTNTSDQDVMTPTEFQAVLFSMAQISFFQKDFSSSVQLLAACVEPLQSTSKFSLTLSSFLSQRQLQPKSSFQYLPFLPAKESNASASSSFGDIFQVMGKMIYLNNVACAYAHQGNKELSSLYFGKALCELSKLESVGDTKSLSSLISPMYLDDIVYNAGLSYLTNGMAQPALDCFSHVSGFCKDRPLYWLRRAECFIILHKQSMGTSKSIDLQFTHHPQSTGQVYFRYPAIKREETNGNTCISPDHLPEALSCLHKAVDLSAAAERVAWGEREGTESMLHNLDIFELLSTVKVGKATDVYSANVSQRHPTGGRGSSPSPDNLGDMRPAEACGSFSRGDALCDAFIESCFLKLAYVYLCIREPVLCLSSLKTCLLKVRFLSAAGSFLVCMYAAEAFCRTGDILKAIQLLEPKYMLIPSVLASLYKSADGGNISKIPTAYRSQGVDSGHWVTDKEVAEVCASCLEVGGAPAGPVVQIIEAVVLTNRAAVLSIQGDLVEAQNILESVVAVFPSFAPAIRTLVYVLVRRKGHSEAVKVLQKYCTQT